MSTAPRETIVRNVLHLIKDGRVLAALDETGVWHSQHVQLEKRLNHDCGLRRRFTQSELASQAEPWAEYYQARVEWCA